MSAGWWIASMRTMAIITDCMWSSGVQNLGIDGTSIRQFNGISLTQCQTVCELENSFDCRSIDYFDDGEETVCNLAALDRHTMQLTPRDKHTYYEFVCESDSRNRAGCPFVGPIKDKALGSRSLVSIDNVSLEECKKNCLTEKSFHCISFDYTPMWSRCSLSMVDREKTVLTQINGTDYYELTCRPQGCPKGDWVGPVEGSSISKENAALKTIESVSIDECKELCRDEADFYCYSVDYVTESNVCHLNTITRDESALTKKPGTDYYELDNCDDQDLIDPCELDKQFGTGTQSIKRFYYDQRREKCKKFKYTGEGGNANNFETRRECALTCEGIQEANAPIDEVIDYAVSDESGIFTGNNAVRMEGDVVVKVNDLEETIEEEYGDNLSKRASLKFDRFRWPDGVILYRFKKGDFTKSERKLITTAMKEWQKNTCVKFKKDGKKRATDYLVIKKDDGCYSYIGMIGGPQTLSLGNGCLYHHVILHELGHAIGFFHEQSRMDRDTYVKIRTQNVADGVMDNFKKNSHDYADTNGVGYDYTSIMHYGKNAFSSNGKITIETLDPDYQNIIGQVKTLSFKDIKEANLALNCYSDCPNEEPCPKKGFRGKNCKCYCPGKNKTMKQCS